MTRRSLRHLCVIASLGGIITLVVAATDANPVWLAVGPLMLATIDIVGYRVVLSRKTNPTTPTRRARSRIVQGILDLQLSPGRVHIDRLTIVLVATSIMLAGVYLVSNDFAIIGIATVVADIIGLVAAARWYARTDLPDAASSNVAAEPGSTSHAEYEQLIREEQEDEDT